jgi:hypothetical protein
LERIKRGMIAGPGQGRALNIRKMVCDLRSKSKTVDLVWVKGHEGTPGNEKANVLARKVAEGIGYSKVMSLAHLKLQIQKGEDGLARRPKSP